MTTRNYTHHINSQGWTANKREYPSEEAADGWHPSGKVRLFPNNKKFRFRGEVHEMVEASLREAGIAIQNAPFVVHHYGELDEDPVKLIGKRQHYFEIGLRKLAQNHDNLSAICELAVQAGELGRFEKGIELWDRLLSKQPDYVEGLFNKGYCLMGLKRYGEALEMSRQVLELEPDHKEAAFNYGTCELYAGDPGQALSILEPVSAQHPDYPLLQALMAVLYFACDKITEGQSLAQNLTNHNYEIKAYIQERIAVLKSLERYEIADKIMQKFGDK